MKKFNEVVLNVTVAILDFLYQGRDIQRFWVLETIEGHIWAVNSEMLQKMFTWVVEVSTIMI